MRLATIAAFAIATLVGTTAASPYSPFLEKRSSSCKNDNDCPGVTCCNLSTLKCVSDPHGTICDIPPKKTTTTKKATTTKKTTTTIKKTTTTTRKTTTTTKKTTTTTKKATTTTKKPTTTTKTTTKATTTSDPLVPPTMNPKPTCRSYTENFSDTVVIEASDWEPTSTSVDMVNISGSKSAYTIKDNMLTLNMMAPEFGSNGKPKSAGVAATLDFAFEMQYGAYEVRMKTSPVNGACTAVNTMSADGDEIDIEIAPSYFNTQPPSIQEYNWWYRGTDNTPQGLTHGGYVNIGQNLTADFHTYRVEWKYDSITWITDGKVIHTVNKADTWDGTKYVYPSEPSRIELGIWDAGYANSGWGGGPIPWHNYKEVNAYFDYVTIECDPTYNTVIGPRSTTAKSFSMSASEPSVNKTLSNGVTIGQHASPGLIPADKSVKIKEI